MKTKYTVDWFIKFFSAIPAQKWITKYLGDDCGRHCAWGHLEQHFGMDKVPYKEFKSVLPGGSATQINDGFDPQFQQKTPRARILAALRTTKRERS